MLIPHYATNAGAARHGSPDMSTLLFVLHAVATSGHYLLFIYDMATGKKRDHSFKYKRDIWRFPTKFGWSDKGVCKFGMEFWAGYQVKAEWKDSWRPTVKIKKNGKFVHNFGLNCKEAKEKPAEKPAEKLPEELAEQAAQQLAMLVKKLRERPGGELTEVLQQCQYDANRQIILIKVPLRHPEPSANLASAPDVGPPLDELG